MAWIIGIDEAGYGPNLGPLVMSLVACRVPDEHANADVWKLLSEAVRRAGERDDGRLLVADSKDVYSSGKTLAGLEVGTLAALTNYRKMDAGSLRDHLPWLAPETVADVTVERWYTGQTELPVCIPVEACQLASELLRRSCAERGVGIGLVRSVLVCPTRFNAIVDRHGSKGAVLAWGLGELLRSACESLPGDDGMAFHIDKHGGRNAYAAMLQDLLGRGVVVARQETAARSVYQVLGLPRALAITFQPRADSEHFCVALASMVSKYLREILMGEFNTFWKSHVPGLKPTAGYPMDAVRFFAAIKPVTEALGIPTDSLWRRK